MTGFDVDFLGCKISQTDAHEIEEALVAAGHERDAVGGVVRVVNSCCITAEAEKKTRQRVRRMLAGAGEEGRVFVTGCGAANHPEQYADISEQVTVLPGAAALATPAIVEAADSLAGLGCRGPVAGIAPGHVAPSRRHGRRTRAFVKVQDGCDFHCSYCIVPAVRGEPRSRSVAAVLDEVARRVAAGQREIVLTGVNIGLFRDPQERSGLDRLLLAVADVPGVLRMRISSIESNHVNRRLVAAMASHPAICPHLHVPLQSGDDAVLAGMRRHYDTRRYERAIEAARAELPDLNLTTDVIVGHPGEDDAAFERTLAFVERIGFTKVHAFPYSARPGTASAAATAQVPKEVAAERSRRLREVADRSALAHRAARVGQVDEVVVETRSATGYGSAAGVLLTDDHAAAVDGGAAPAGRPASGATVRTGYTRDYSPVCFVDDLPADVEDGTLVAVDLDALDRASGLLVARLR